MSSSDEEHSPSLADRLVTACDMGDLPSAKAAVADGASVNEWGSAPGWGADLPLRPAVAKQHDDVAVWLLSHGADPNGDHVMSCGARSSTAAMLQLLIDAGGDVNRGSYGQPPLFTAIRRNSADNVRVLLAQPLLDLTIQYEGKTLEQYARAYGTPAVAGFTAKEVSGKGSVLSSMTVRPPHCSGVAVAGRSRDERRRYDHCYVRFVYNLPSSGHDWL